MNTTASDSWDGFVAELRTDILLHAPMKSHEEEEHTETWEELMNRLRFETEHPDRELRAALAEREAEIERLKARVADLQQKAGRLRADATGRMPEIPVVDETSIYERQIEQARQFVSENSKADVSRLRDLLRRIMPAEFHGEIDNIREGKAFTHIEISGGNNQILPGADVGVQNNSYF